MFILVDPHQKTVIVEQDRQIGYWPIDDLETIAGVVAFDTEKDANIAVSLLAKHGEHCKVVPVTQCVFADKPNYFEILGVRVYA